MAEETCDSHENACQTPIHHGPSTRQDQKRIHQRLAGQSESSKIRERYQKQINETGEFPCSSGFDAIEQEGGTSQPEEVNPMNGKMRISTEERKDTRIEQIEKRRLLADYADIRWTSADNAIGELPPDQFVDIEVRIDEAGKEEHSRSKQQECELSTRSL